MAATASSRVDLEVDGVLNRLWLEGSGEDPATGEPVVEVKLGLKLPIQGLIEALTKLQQKHPRTQPTSGEAPRQQVQLPDQSFVVTKGGFIEHDTPDSPQRAALLRTSTAPPEYSRVARETSPDGDGLEAVAEEGDDQAEDAAGARGAAGICRTVTRDPWENSAPPGIDAPVFAAPPHPELAFVGMPPMPPMYAWPVPHASNWEPWQQNWQQDGNSQATGSRSGSRTAEEQQLAAELATAKRPLAPPSREEPPAKPRKPDIESSLDGDGVLRVTWNAMRKKLEGKDQSMVSPKINLAIGDAKDCVPFTMTIRPKARGDKKGQASFAAANKQGHIELSCNNQSCLGSAAPDMTFRLAVGSGLWRREKGLFTHNFAKEKVFSVPKAEEDWEFDRAIKDPESGRQTTENELTFSVHLEITKGDGVQWRCLAGGAAPVAAATGGSAEALSTGAAEGNSKGKRW